MHFGLEVSVGEGGEGGGGRGDGIKIFWGQKVRRRFWTMSSLHV